MNEMLTQLLAMPSGARFYRVDLHNHTPADAAFHCSGFAVDTEEQKHVFARAYVAYLKEAQGIEIAGITEHNDVSWLPYIQAAADEIELTVFPGVELGANSGKRQVHFLALFDPGTDAETIDHFVSSLGLTPKNRFFSDGTPKLVDLDCRELMRRITGVGNPRHGIPVAAHAPEANGLFHELEGGPRVLAYGDPHLLAVEIPASRLDLCQFNRRLVNGKLDDYDNKSVACLNQSDGRGLTETEQDRRSIGSRHTNIKLSRLSVEALRQAFIDFDSRVRLADDARVTNAPQVLGLVVDGPGEARFLRARPDGPYETQAVRPFSVHFNPNLNTLIGGRGAGKSSVLEALRYALDLQPRTVATREQADNIIAATLQSGSCVTVFYEMADGTRYQITRRKGFDPEVIDIATGEKRSVAPSQLLPGGAPVEIYGQKEIFEISKSVTFQLNLLDTYIAEPLNDLQRQDAELIHWLASNATDIARLQDEVEQAEQLLRELEGVKLELERMERHQAAAQLTQKKLAEREKTLLDQAAATVEERLASLNTFAGSLEAMRLCLPDGIATEGLAHAETLEAQASLLERIDAETKAALDALETQTRAIWAEGSDQRSHWQTDYEKAQADYEALVAELGGDFSSERYFAQQARRQTLEGIGRETGRRRRQLAALHQERSSKLRTLRRLRRARIFRLRRRKAQDLTNVLSGTIRITVTLAGNRRAYADYLAEIFAGRRITRGVCEILATSAFPAVKGTPSKSHYPDPMHLARAIRCERSTPTDSESLLSTIYGVSAAYRQRLAAVEDEVLYQLEAYQIPDLPDICLQVGHQYRSLTPEQGQPGLSTGQKCTAILSLILVERDAPLVIDQPEDDLDNEFIYREIVQTLRREKENRQFIIATHNANIPVSGDAELILAMQADQAHGWIEYAGSIDDPEIRKPVEDILEGGRDAFEFRQKKYGILE